MLRAAAKSDSSGVEIKLKISIIDNKISKRDYDLANDIPIEISDSEKTVYSNAWRTYHERNTNLENHSGQAYSLILVKYTQLLQDKMNQDTAWNVTITSYNPLVLLRLIEKTVLEYTEDQYPFATVYSHEFTFYTFQQVSMNNP